MKHKLFSKLNACVFWPQQLEFGSAYMKIVDSYIYNRVISPLDSQLFSQIAVPLTSQIKEEL